jgi:hypothetical protein
MSLEYRLKVLETLLWIDHRLYSIELILIMIACLLTLQLTWQIRKG